MKALLILALCAQPDSLVLAVSGASALEDLDESQMELYQHLETNPVNINFASRSALLSCGLFTQFQVVSLIEYRSQWGDILSMAELAAVDGFGESFARAVEPYVSLRSRAPAGQSSAALERRGEASARVWAKGEDGTGALSYAGKAKYGVGSILSAGVAFKRSYSPSLSLPEVFNWSVALSGRRIPATLIVGDFNARLGQGMLMWSGFSLSGASSISAFYKRPSGLSPSVSYTPTGLRGAAAQLELGQFTLGAALALPARKGRAGTALAGVSWYGLRAQAGLNAVRSAHGTLGLSCDFRLNTGKTDLFGEAAWSSDTRQMRGLAGAVINFDYDIITQDSCDVKAQLLMRVFEIFEAIKIIRQAIRDLPEGKITDRSWEMVDTDLIESYIEVPRGTLYHSYAIEDGRVRHCIIRTPSMSNIGAMQYACIDNHITDGQLCIVQCDPCFTCSDRAIEVYDTNNNKLDKSILQSNIH